MPVMSLVVVTVGRPRRLHLLRRRAAATESLHGAVGGSAGASGAGAARAKRQGLARRRRDWWISYLLVMSK